MTHMSFNNFSKAITSIKEAYDTDTLYQKTVVNGKLQKKSGWALIGATYKHFKLWLNDGIKQDNEKRMEKLFNDCVEDLKTVSSESELFNEEALLKDIPSPYTLKITKFVINTLENNKKISDEKIKIVDQLKKTADLLTHDSSIVEDPDWLAIHSIKEVRDLNKKLENPYADLNEQETTLMKRCLRLFPEILKVEESCKNAILPIADNPKEFNAIKKIGYRFVHRADHLREEYGKMYGSVKSDANGRLLPTKKQLQGAFELAFKKMPLLMQNRSDENIRKLAARAVYTLMCDDEQTKSAEFPNNDFSFFIREVNETEKERDHKIKNTEYSSYLEFQIMTQVEALAKIITDKFKDLAGTDFQIHLDSKNPRVIELILLFNKEPKKSLETLIPHVLLTEGFLQSEEKKLEVENLNENDIKQAKKNLRSHLKSNLKEQLDKGLKKLEEQDLKEIKDNMQVWSIQKYLGNFLYDTVTREAYITLGKKQYNLAKGELNKFLIDFQQNYYEFLKNPQNLIDTLEQNKQNQAITGIKASLSAEEFKHHLSAIHGNEMSDSISNIINGTSFTEKQIQELKEASFLTVSKPDIESLLRVKMMQLMIIINQSTEGLEPQSLNPSHLESLQMRMNAAFNYNNVKFTPVERTWVINPDFNGVKLTHKINISAPYDNIADKVNTSVRTTEVTLASLVKKVDIDQFLPVSSKSNVGTLNESIDFGVSIDAAPSIDTIFKLFSVDEKK
jgi:hypothetical protein